MKQKIQWIIAALLMIINWYIQFRIIALESNQSTGSKIVLLADLIANLFVIGIFALPITAISALFLSKSSSYKARAIKVLPWALIVVLTLVILVTGPFGHVKTIRYH